MDTINLGPENLGPFIKAYDQAVAGNKPQFEFQKKDFHTDYAKYMLEHLCNLGKVRKVWSSETKSFTLKPV